MDAVAGKGEERESEGFRVGSWECGVEEDEGEEEAEGRERKEEINAVAIVAGGVR